jgi:transposase-like protein
VKLECLWEGNEEAEMRERRRYSVAFKRQVVEELLSKASSLGQLSRRAH